MPLNQSFIFALGAQKVFDTKTVNLSSDTIRVTLMRNSFANTTMNSVKQRTMDHYNTVPDTDRAAGGTVEKELSTPGVQLSAAGNKIFFADTLTSVTFGSPSASQTLSGILVWKSSGAQETASPLIQYNHFTTSIAGNGQDVTVNFHANGLHQLSWVGS